MEVFACTDTAEQLSTVLKKLEELRPDVTNKVSVVGQEDYSSVLDFILSRCRQRGSFRKRLLLPSADIDVVLRLLLKSANKELTGDSSHTCSEFLQLRSSVEKARKKGEWPAELGDSTVDLAAKNYQEFLKKCNLVDVWAVGEEFKKELEEGEQTRCLLLHGNISNSDTELLDRLGYQSCTNLVFESNNIQSRETCQLSEMVKGKPEQTIHSFGSNQGMQCLTSVLRLVVNTRDEIALARVLTQTGLLSAVQCHVVRQETEKSNLAMYQHLVSYVTQTSLGGKSYAPGEEHPFVEFESQLEDFVKLMERIQTRIEETPDAFQALEKVTGCVHSWLQKKGIQIKEEDLESWKKLCTRILNRQKLMDATPGRGLIGRPGIKLVTGLVDLLSCLPDTEETVALSKTPRRSKKLLNFFRTPVTNPSVNNPEEDMDEFDRLADEAGVAEKLGVESSSTPISEVKPSYVRFKSSLAWAQESSPVPDSASRSGVRVGGSTLVSAAYNSPSTPLRHVENVSDILAEIKEREAKERLEDIEQRKKDIAKPRIKSRKRILAKEAEEEAEKKFGVESKKQKSDYQEKKVREKKKPSTPKGQTKLTSFFSR